jgi:hypothetical protein
LLVICLFKPTNQLSLSLFFITLQEKLTISTLKTKSSIVNHDLFDQKKKKRKREKKELKNSAQFKKTKKN